MQTTASDRPDFAGYRRAVAAGVAALSVLVLADSWVRGVDIATGFAPRAAAMAPSTAVCLLLLSSAVVVPGRVRTATCAVVGVVAVAALLEPVVGSSVSTVDGLLPQVEGRPEELARMSGATALCLLLLAAALGWSGRHRKVALETAGVTVVSLTGLAFLGYLFGVTGLYSFTPFATLSVPTALGLQALATTLLSLVMGGLADLLVRGQDIGAGLFRRLAPVIFMVLPLLSYAVARAGEAGLWDESFSPAVVVATWISAMGGATWLLAVRIGQVDRRRERALAELALLNAELEARADARVESLAAEQRHSSILEERQRIAADLHDRVVQGLFAAGMWLHSEMEERDDRQGSDQPEELGAGTSNLERVTDLIDGSVRDLRASVHALHRSERASPTGVGDDLERLVESARSTVPRVDLDVDGTLDDIPPAEANQLVAAAQEAVSNARRHADPSSITVRVEVDERRARLTVSDDGVGMPETIDHPGGTRNLRDRAEAFGGGCTWSPTRADDATTPGTTVSWWVQLDLDTAAEVKRLRQALVDPPDQGLVDGAAACVAALVRPSADRRGSPTGAEGSDLVQGVLDQILSTVRASSGIIVVPDPDDAGALRVHTALGPVGPVSPATAIPRAESLAARVMETRQGLTIDQVGDLPSARRAFGSLPIGPGVLLPVPGPTPSSDSPAALFLGRAPGAAPFDAADVARARLLAVFLQVTL